MALFGKQKRHLRSLAHHLQAVVWIGHDGLSDAVLAKIETELNEHELIKVKVGKGPLNRKAAAAELTEKTGAEIAQILGKTLLLYRAHEESPVIQLPQRAESTEE